MVDWIKVYEELATKNRDPRVMMGYQKDGMPASWDIMYDILNDIKTKLRLKPDSKFLDVGGGVGLCSKFCQIRDAYLLDTSQSMLRKSDLENKILSELSNLPFNDHVFDRLLCYSVFHYLKDYEHAKKAVCEFLRVTKKNGIIMIGDVLRISTKETQLAYKPEFFKNNFTNTRIFEQDIKGKTTIKERYDVLIYK